MCPDRNEVRTHCHVVGYDHVEGLHGIESRESYTCTCTDSLQQEVSKIIHEIVCRENHEQIKRTRFDTSNVASVEMSHVWGYVVFERGLHHITHSHLEHSDTSTNKLEHQHRYR